ncbi:MAG: hypothetical protein HOY76_31450 [Streptomyces sp.]|nr:hypothetical protein [Streptomyces sp.]
MLSFHELVGGQDVFFERHFNARPLLRRRALEDGPDRVLTLSAMDDLVNLEGVRPPYISIAKDGRPVPEQAFTRATLVTGAVVPDAVAPGRVRELFDSGATITWMALNQIHPGVREFCRMFGEVFATRSDAVAFLTPPGTQGYEAHRDAVDVFVVQLEGRKRWRLWDDRSAGTGLCDVEELGAPSLDVLLEPGDLLYIPYHTPHVAVAEDETSLHLSVTLRPRTWRDLMLLTLHRVLGETEFDDYPHVASADTARLEKELGSRFEELARRLEQLDLGEEMGHYVAVGRSMEGSSAVSLKSGPR